MIKTLNTIKAIFVKDIINEIRSKQTFSAMIVLSIIIVWLFRLISSYTQLSPITMAPAVIILAAVFSSVLSSERCFSVEYETSCIDALTLAASDKADIYLAKLLFNTTMLCVFDIIIVPLTCIFFNITPQANILYLIMVLLLINIAIAAPATLLGNITQTIKAKGSLLSILIIAMIMPVIIPALSALIIAMGSDPLTQTNILTTQPPARPAAIIAAFDAIFVTICWLLFGFTID